MRKSMAALMGGLILLFCGTTAGAVQIIYRDGDPDPLAGGTYQGVEDNTILQNSDSSGETDQNFGARSDFGAGEVSTVSGYSPRHGLMRFDVSSLAGEFAQIDAVTLRLTLKSVDTAAGSEILQLFRLADANAGWIEGTGVGAPAGAPPDNGESTWLQRVQGSTNWAGSVGASTPGTDYTTLLATAAFDSSSTGTLDLVFDTLEVDGLINDWITGTNAGVFLRTADQLNDLITFHSSEAASISDRPQLIIDYTVVPEPGTSGLLGLGGLLLWCLRRRL